MTTEPGTSPAEHTIAEAWHELTERWTVRELVAYAQTETDYCCQAGCGGGGCESCPCCHAGYCVSGLDGVPKPGSELNPNDDHAHAAEVYRNWLEVAAEHNPVAAALATSESGNVYIVHHHDIEKTAEHFNQGFAEACEQFESLLTEAREDLVLEGPAVDLMGYLANAIKSMRSGDE